MPKQSRREVLKEPGQHDGTILAGVALHNADACLVSSPSSFARSAIEVINTAALYGLLHLETLGVDDRTLAVRRKARLEAVKLAKRHKAWSAIERRLRDAIACARQLEDVSAYGLRVKPPDSIPIDVPLVTVLEILEALATHEAKNLISVSFGNLGEVPGKLTMARRMAKFPARHSSNSTRIRLAALCRLLKKAGWTRRDVANLIVASQSDWQEPPVRIAPAFMYRPEDLTSRYVSVSARATSKQEKLVQWIKDTLDAEASSSRR